MFTGSKSEAWGPKTCTYCRTRFTVKSAFQIHLSHCTRKPNQRPNLAPVGDVEQSFPASTSFSCEVCQRSFAKPNALRMHIEMSKEHKAIISVRNPTRSLSQHESSPVSVALPNGAILVNTPGVTGNDYLNGEPEQGLDETASQSHFNRDDRPIQVGGLRAISGHKSDLPIRQFIPVYDSPATASTSKTKDDRIAHDWAEVLQADQPNLLLRLRKSCHVETELVQHQYKVQHSAVKDIESRRKCRNCHRKFCDLPDQGKNHACTFHPGKKARKDGGETYNCCGNASNVGCTTVPKHLDNGLVSRLAKRDSECIKVSAPIPGKTWSRKAVVLDCEMVSVQDGQDELVLLCAVDCLTNEVLVETFVEPLKQVINWRTKWSGVSREIMQAAISDGTAVKGWRAARQILLQYIDSDTILIGHALHHDLDVLRLIHTRVVDTGIIAQNAQGPEWNQNWALKTLCEEFLDLKIQNHGKKGHNCREDTMATREVAIWCMNHESELKAWGLRKAQAALQKRENQQRLDEQKEASAEASRAGLLRSIPAVASSWRNVGEDDSEFCEDEDDSIEHMTHAEFLEAIHYPPWYDNFSD